MCCMNLFLVVLACIWSFPSNSNALNREFLLQARAQACSLDDSIITTIKSLGILKKKKSQGGSRNIAAFFYNVDGREQLERNLDPSKIGSHSFTFFSETYYRYWIRKSSCDRFRNGYSFCKRWYSHICFF